VDRSVLTGPASGFLNVDVDLQSATDLSPFIQALGKRIVCTHSGRSGRRYWVRFVLSRQPKSPNDAIRALARLVDSLPPGHRRHWSRATHREFDIGVEGRGDQHTVESVLDLETLKCVTRLGASLRLTAYPPSEDEGTNRKAAQQ